MPICGWHLQPERGAPTQLSQKNAEYYLGHKNCMKPSHECRSQPMGKRPNGTLFEETEGNLESPLGAPRITEQPRRRGSSARYVRDAMAQDYQPRVVVDRGAQDPKTAFSSPGTFLFVSFEVAAMVLELTRCRRLKSPACMHMMCIAHRKQRRSR